MGKLCLFPRSVHYLEVCGSAQFVRLPRSFSFFHFLNLGYFFFSPDLSAISFWLSDSYLMFYLVFSCDMCHYYAVHSGGMHSIAFAVYKKDFDATLQSG